MPTIVDQTSEQLAAQGQDGALVPVSPFTALQFHFGMLLGVDDLETGQAYPRGKIRLHDAWLHREGVVWGMNVRFNPDAGNELVVDPGLALDAAGHELHLDQAACLDVGQWYAANRGDSSFTFTDASNVAGGKQFDAHVVVRFKACLTRPVPAIVEPCTGAQTDTAYSRVFETVELLLRPGKAQPKELPYPRLRILFDLVDDSQPPYSEARYADVRTTRDTIRGLPPDQQPRACLQAFRRFAALDEIDLQPQAATSTEPASIFPEDPTEVVLADLPGIVVQPAAADGWVIATPVPTPDPTVRPTLVATATIQELLCRALSPASAAAPLGPMVTDAQLDASTGAITFTTSREIVATTLTPAAFSVTDYSDAAGWSDLAVQDPVVRIDPTHARIDVGKAPAGTHVRLVIRGTGPTPLLGAADHLPLGAPGAGGAADGTDFVKMFERS